MPPPFSVWARIYSLRYAFRGIALMLRTQHNAWLHAVATVLILFAGFLLRFAVWEWTAIVLALAVVWTAEGLNTALEFLANAVSAEFNPIIRDAKDVAAGAVFIAALGSLIVGLLVFWPHL